MALQRDTVSVPFVGGIDTKSDAKTVAPTKLTLLENGEFTKYGSIRKRRGYSETELRMTTGYNPITESSGETFASPKHLFTRGDETVLLTHNRLYSLDTKNDSWLDRGPIYTGTHTAKEVCYVNAAQTFADMATVNGVTVYAWEDSRTANRIRYSILDDSGAVYLHDTSLFNGNCSRPSCVVVGSNILLFFVDNANTIIKCKLIRTNDIKNSISAAASSAISDIAGTFKYAVCSDGSTAYVAWETDGSGSLAAGIGLAALNSVGTITTQVQVVTPYVPLCMSVAVDSVTSRVSTAYADATNYHVGQEFEASTLVQTAAGSDTAQADITKIAQAKRGGTGTVFEYWVEVQPAGSAASNYYVLQVSDANVYTIRHAFLASEGFYDSVTGSCHILLGHDSRTGVQNSYYLYGIYGRLQGTVLSGVASSTYTKDHLPHLQITPDLKFAGVLVFKRKLDVTLPAVGRNAAFSHRGLKRVEFDPNAKTYTAELGSSAYITGSQTWLYDSQGATEAGFTMFPDVINTATANTDIAFTNSATGRLVASTQYNYRIYYCWYTDTGEKVKSAALTIAGTTPAFASGTGYATITIPTLTHTRRWNDTTLDWARSHVFLEIYRTEGNKSILYYKASSSDPTTAGATNGFLYNTLGANTVSFVDGNVGTMTEAVLITQELDSFVGGGGGELENIGPAGSEFVAALQDRLWLAGGERSEDAVEYSKIHSPGDTVQCNDALTVVCGDNDTGPVKAIADLNGAPALFKDRTIYTVLGTGPDNSGGGDSYVAQQITSDVGCVEPRALVKIPGALLFVSAKGIYILDSSLTVKYFGLDVEGYNGQSFTSARLVPDTNQVIWLSDTGTTLLFDYQFNQWSTYTNHRGLAGIYRNDNGKYAYLRTNGAVFTQDDTAYTDAGNSYVLKARTAPIRLSDILQGFAKLRRFEVIGEYKSAHTLNVSLYYDREPSAGESFSWDPSDVIDLSTWGSFTVWDDDAVWGGSGYGGQEYQFQHKPARQKFQTIRFEFSDTPGSPPGASFEITEIALEAGVKPGLSRLSAARKV